MTTSGNLDSLSVRCVVASRRGARPDNEDAVALAGWALLPDSGGTLDITLAGAPGRPVRIALTDGMGGRPAGALAAQIAACHLTQHKASGCADGGIGAPAAQLRRLRTLFEGADDAVRAAATEASRGLGCTAAYIEIAPDGSASIANVGDVRVYQQLDGYLGLLTRDDRPPAGGAGVVSRCLGGARRDDVTPHHYGLQLRASDILIAATDGVHEVVPMGVLEGAARTDLAVAVNEIIGHAAVGPDADNMTVLGIEVLSVSLPAAGPLLPPAVGVPT